MDSFPTLTVTVALGNRSRVLAGQELPDEVRRVLTRLLLEAGACAAQLDSGKEGEGGGWGSVPLPGTVTNERNSDRLFPVVPGKGKEEGSGEEPSGRDEDDIHSLASYLADALGDRKSLRWYELVARTVPYDVVRHALTRSLDFRRDEVRRSRAAYFTAIVKPYVPRRRPVT
ncbi:MAG: hypothetical protein IT373_37885 [Polyangiaceae bacterium]|nr:hypothetical protein [Polyangiaceae bacterium]